MPQNPSSEPPQILVGKFLGLNDQRDSIQRPQGTTSSEMNILDDQSGDASRRPGRDFESLQEGSVQIIFPLEWDDGGVTVLTQSGSVASYSAVVYNDNGSLVNKFTNPNTPGPMPNAPFLQLPFIKASNSIPDLTSLMRALSDAVRYFNGAGTDFNWADQVWAFDAYDKQGNFYSGGIRSKDVFLSLQSKGYHLRPTLAYGPVPAPIDGRTIPDNFYWIDYVAKPELALLDLARCINNYNFTLPYYLKTYPVDGASSWVNFDASDYINDVPTKATLSRIWARVANLINQNLLRIKVDAPDTQDNSASKGIWNDDGFFSGVTVAQMRACLLSNIDSISVGWFGKRAVASSCSQVSLDPFVGLPPTIGAYGYIASDACQAWMQGSAGSFTADLSVYSSDTTASARLLIQTQATAGGVFTGGPFAISGNYYDCGLTVTVGSVWTSDDYTYGVDFIKSPFIATAPTVTGGFAATAYGWEVLGSSVILEKKQPYIALGPYNTTKGSSVITPNEDFSLQADQTATGETDISWGTVKLSESGGASRAYPQPTATGSAVNFGPSTSLNFNQEAPGFDKARFKGSYRPVILATLSLACFPIAGVATSVTVKLYINGTLVRTTTGISPNGGVIPYAFSILDVGDFSDVRPPDNDASNQLDGWAAPSVRITVTPDAGSLTISKNTLLQDYVLPYP